MDLRDKVAVITGGNRGIGKAISLLLSQKGAKVAVNYARGAESAEAVVKEIDEIGGRAIKVKADVVSKMEVSAMVQTVLNHFGRIDILINNAGVVGQPNFLEISEADWDLVIDVNLKGVFNCCQAIIPVFLKQGGGKIVNISSVAGKMGGTSGAHYGASKAGVIGLTMALSTEFGKENILVNAIAPGPVKTDMFQSLSDALKKRLADSTHLGRVSDPSEMAHGVLFLLENDFVTGETLNMSAGRYMD